MAVSNIDGILFTALSALNGRTLSTLSAIDGFTITAAPPGPSTIASIWEWWEPSREVGLNDNDPISTMTGQFAAKNYTAVGTNRPTYKTNILNGLAVADMTAGGKLMDGPNASALTAGHTFIVLNAVNDPGLTARNTPVCWGTASIDLWPFTNGQVYSTIGTDRLYATGVDPTPSLAAWRVFEVVTTSSEYTVKLDGSVLNTTATNTVTFGTVLQICGNAITGTASFYGQQAGWYIFSAKLSAGDRTTMVTYLNSRFGLSIT